MYRGAGGYLRLNGDKVHEFQLIQIDLEQLNQFQASQIL